MRRLIVKLGRETGWGYTRILGELKKLGTCYVSRNTVRNILRQHGLDPGPRRGVGTWDELMKIHAATLRQCDFFSKRVLTPRGFRLLFVMTFLHVGSRRVFLTPATQHPNEAWVVEQAEAFVHHMRAKRLSAETIMHDRDTKFTARFDAALRKAGLKVRRSAFRAPAQRHLSSGSFRPYSKTASIISSSLADVTWITSAGNSSNTIMSSGPTRAWTTSYWRHAARKESGSLT
jgi:putative transposase